MIKSTDLEFYWEQGDLHASLKIHKEGVINMGDVGEVLEGILDGCIEDQEEVINGNTNTN